MDARSGVTKTFHLLVCTVSIDERRWKEDSTSEEGEGRRGRGKEGRREEEGTVGRERVRGTE